MRAAGTSSGIRIGCAQQAGRSSGSIGSLLIATRLVSVVLPSSVSVSHGNLRRALGQGGVFRGTWPCWSTCPRHGAHEAPVHAPEQARAILMAVRGDRIEGVVALTLATGLRQGEALALRWSGVDVDGGTLTVRRTLHRIGGEVRFAEPKTARSRRPLALSAGTVAGLRAHRTRQLQERLLAGSRWQEGDLVFTSTIGTPMTAGDLTKRFQRLLVAAGLPRWRSHDLRHGTASLLIAQGVHPRTVMEILGHSTITVTMNVYAHVAPALQREAAERMDALLGDVLPA